MKLPVNIIFHIDLNAFFASVEAIESPFLKNKVFAVGGGLSFNRGGMLTTASYKARKYGIRSGMSVAEAMNLYPKLIVVPNRRDKYIKYSKLFIEHLRTYTDVVYQASIDEAYLDVTEQSKHIHPLKLAKDIQDTLLKKYQLPCSIGIAPTLFLAKMASDMKKPMGITVIRRRDVKEKLFPLEIDDMYGIGKKTAPRLHRIGIKTIGDFADPMNKEKILEIMSQASYESHIDEITGYSNQTVDPDKYAIPKSVSNETTLPYDVDNIDTLREWLNNLLKENYDRLIKEGLMTRTVGIRLRHSDFRTISKAKTLVDYTDQFESLSQEINDLFDFFYNDQPIRLIGVSFNNVIQKSDYKQDINLFNYHEHLENT